MGVFHRMLERRGSLERYNMVPLADAMLAEDASLRRAFADWRAANPDVAEDTGARLQWFADRTPYADQLHLEYPIARELAAIDNR